MGRPAGTRLPREHKTLSLLLQTPTPMASPSASCAQAAVGPSLSPLAHLPDASEELGRTADLTITVEGTQLKLHSVVAAAGSRVLRTALCSFSGDGPGAAAAVQAAFEGCKLADVQLFLK